jgi:hypothetical protein
MVVYMYITHVLVSGHVTAVQIRRTNIFFFIV